MSQRSRRRRPRLRTSGRKKLLLAFGIPTPPIGLGFLAGAIWVLGVYNSAPSLASLNPIAKGTASKVYAADGSLIGLIHSDTIGQPIGTADIPEDLKNATVDIEDRRFFDHGGIDPS